MKDHIHQVMEQAHDAFQSYQFCLGKDKKVFLYTIAKEIEALGDELLETAARESNLPIARFIGERARTCNVFKMFGDLVEEGSWVEAVIDHSQPKSLPLPKPEMRKMLIPLGPIVVFGASNFPLAYSTPGGDTASALAAGCPVVVKGHPLHPVTSSLIAKAIGKAIDKHNLPKFTFQLLTEDSFETGKLLVQHPLTAGVGFTGSLHGGRAIFDYAQNRKIPIPVFAEMGSINPVIWLPEVLKTQTESWAKAFADSITMGVGQFCTKPGIQLAVKSEALDKYIQLLAQNLAQKKNYKMLSQGIHQNYKKDLEKVLTTKGVKPVYHRENKDDLAAELAIVQVEGSVFEANPRLHEEVFGPYSMVVVCENEAQLICIWQRLKGQLTTSIMGTEADLKAHASLVKIARNIAGRIVFNMTPTGVEVGNATVHGGPYPATTDPRFTSVGMDAIKRWVRPICYQDCPDYLLPAELQEINPLRILRKVDGKIVR